MLVAQFSFGSPMGKEHGKSVRMLPACGPLAANPLSHTMNDISKLQPAEFVEMSRQILRGLGVSKMEPLDNLSPAAGFRVPITRKSTDEMYETIENWVCIFIPPKNALAKQTRHLANQAREGTADRFFLVAFGGMAVEAREELHAMLAVQKVQLTCLTGALAERLAHDFGTVPGQESVPAAAGFSFRRLRVQTREKVDLAPWQKHLQTLTVLPVQVIRLDVDPKNALNDADLVGAAKGGSLLLLGAPGAGKTTSLLALGRDLAKEGLLTPVFVPLGRYEGDLWATLGEALAAGTETVPTSVTRELTESGALVLLLDGMNEVQDPALGQRLTDELNALTAPEADTARSCWVVSGRVHDYQQSHLELHHLEKRRWEVQRFTSDLIFKLLVNAFDESEAQKTWRDMSPSLREVCSSPLLLGMLVYIRRERDKVPVARGALYREFINLLLDRTSDNRFFQSWDQIVRKLGRGRSSFRHKRLDFQKLWGNKITEEVYYDLAQKALISLATRMTTTQIRWEDGLTAVTTGFADLTDSAEPAVMMLNEMISVGMLHRDFSNRLSFFHHTMQEYFCALQLTERPVEELIPDEGTDAAQRETVIFAAGMKKDPTTLIHRALEIDLELAAEVVFNMPVPVPPEVSDEVANRLWLEAIKGGGFIGGKRSWANAFRRLATLRGKKIEELARTATKFVNENSFVNDLLRFYGELGDDRLYQELLAKFTSGDEVPDSFLWETASFAARAGRHEEAVKHYLKYLKSHQDSPAWGNLGNSYKALGRYDLALEAYQKALSSGPTITNRVNYARLMYERYRRTADALEQVTLALDSETEFTPAHDLMADLLEKDEPEKALFHREQAVRFASHDEDLRRYLKKLVPHQEKLGRRVDAYHSYRRMIDLDPTSREVVTWKRAMSANRLALDAENQKRPVRERLLSQRDLPLHDLACAWVEAAGLEVKEPSQGSVIASGYPRKPDLFPIALMSEPRITGDALETAIKAVRARCSHATRGLVITGGESLAPDAHRRWATLQNEFAFGVINSLEIRNTLLQTEHDCRKLLDDVTNRAGQSKDPFKYTSIVQEPTEFFGRHEEIAEITRQIATNQQIGLFGIHKVGKSSLLAQLRQTLLSELPDLEVLKVELAEEKRASDFYRKVLQQLSHGRPESVPTAITSTQFRDRLYDHHLLNRKTRRGHKFLLIVDEYSQLFPDTNPAGGVEGFIDILGSLKVMNQEGWLLLLPCGRSAVLNRNAGWKQGENPFLGLLYPFYLGPLQREQAAQMLQTLALRARLEFQPEALDKIFDETGGHPSLTRAMGSQLLLLRVSRITPQEVASAVDAFLKDADRTAVIKAIYEHRMNRHEQEIARRLATQGPQEMTAFYPAEAGLERRRKIRDAVQSLVDTKVLQEQPDGRIAHRYGLMKRLIEQESRQFGLV
jgi:tetratricopeptide (TPR) repeat protein